MNTQAYSAQRIDPRRLATVLVAARQLGQEAGATESSDTFGPLAPALDHYFYWQTVGRPSIAPLAMNDTPTMNQAYCAFQDAFYRTAPRITLA